MRWQVFASYLQVVWSNADAATVGEEDDTSRLVALVHVVKRAEPEWSDDECREFIDAQIRSFRSLGTDQNIRAEIARRSEQGFDTVAAEGCLSRVGTEVDSEKQTAQQAVIAGLIGEMYRPTERIAYILDHVLNVEGDIDMDDGSHEDEPAGSPTFEGWLKGSREQRLAIEQALVARERTASARLRIAKFRSLVGKSFLSVGGFVLLAVVGGSGFQIWGSRYGRLTTIQLTFGWIVLLGILWLLATHDRLNAAINVVLRRWEREELHWTALRDQDRSLLHAFRSGAWGSTKDLLV